MPRVTDKPPNCICSGCGEDFYKPQSELNRALKKNPDSEHFCCKKCEWGFVGMWVNLKCAVCQKPFSRKINKVGNTRHYYCSRACTAKSSTAEYSLSGAALHKKLREAVVGDKMSECLGWCGRIIKSDANKRFCPTCKQLLKSNNAGAYDTSSIECSVYVERVWSG